VRPAGMADTQTQATMYPVPNLLIASPAMGFLAHLLGSSRSLTIPAVAGAVWRAVV